MLINFVVKAESVDYSVSENNNNFLPAVFLKTAEIFLSDDFIIPISTYNKEEIEKNVLRSEKKSWTYVVKKGDTIWQVSKKFNISLKEILTFNNLKENSVIKEGDKLFIPGIKPKVNVGTAMVKEFAGKYVSALKEIGDLVIPVSGFNWGYKHSLNGTDIAAPCGNEVFAADSGIVVVSSDGWNSGYGNYIILRHYDSSYTLYGHLQMRLVEIGEKVEKGDLIGYVGNSGYTLGPTGCHLHFEIRGKNNPLLR